MARHLALRARWIEGDRSSRLLARAEETASALAAGGFLVPTLDARLLAAQVALALGRGSVARRELALVSDHRRRGPVGLRSRAWHAEALLRLEAGNRTGAGAALRTGVQLLDQHRATLGATELRAYASAHVEDLARLGVHLSIQEGRPQQVFAWAERWRAGALRLRPARPPVDPRLAADLTALRAVVAEIEQAALSGQATDDLLATQTTLERAVRDRARHAPGMLASPADLPPSCRSLAQVLGNRVLLELIDDDGTLYAVRVGAGRPRLYRLGTLAEVEAEVEHLRFALRRLAVQSGSDRTLRAAEEAATFSANRLDELLLAPAVTDIVDRPLVIVPTGPLHVLPWSVLPSNRGRAVTVAPSACVWHRAVTAADDGRPQSIVLAAGPRLAHAEAEVKALARRYRGARVFTSRRATCEALGAALDGATLAHLAAHGRFRSDNPLFSCVEVADGALTVYDLERLDRAPLVVVLSACDSGVSAVRPGDELMGLTAAVLTLGARTLVASVVPVPDAATRPLMLSLHAGLRAGLTPATALARAQARSADAGPGAAAAAAAFVCFGAGHRPLTG